MVAMNIRITLKRIQGRKPKRKWNLEKLAKSGNFADQLENEMTRETPTAVEERWTALKEKILKTAEDQIGYQNKKTPKKPWITQEMIQAMDERRKWKHQTTEKAKKEYRRLNNELRRKTDKAREEWWSEQCSELERLLREGKEDLVYKRVKHLGRDHNKSHETNIRDKEGQLLTESKEVMKRWHDYIEELYNKKGKPKQLDMEEQQQSTTDIGPDLLQEEIQEAINELKNGKAEGADGIPAEILKNLGEHATKELIGICQEIYVTGIWPEDFLQSLIVPIEKKRNATNCEDYRTISLLSHASKIMLKVVHRRLEGRMETLHFLGEDQYEFRRGKGTREAIGALRVISERSIEHGNDLYICFVDYEKAFDRVDWTKLMNTLKRLGVDWRDRQLITNLYMGQSFSIRINGEKSEEGIIG